MKKLIAGLITGGLLLSMTAGLAGASSSEGNIGNGQGAGKDLDINAYCVHTNQGPDSSIITGTQDWACSNDGTGTAINLHNVCQFEWPGFNSVKELREGDALSWQCFK